MQICKAAISKIWLNPCNILALLLVADTMYVDAVLPS